MEVTWVNDKNKISMIAVEKEDSLTSVSEVVRQNIEETLNGQLDARPNTLCRQGTMHATQSAQATALDITNKICTPKQYGSNQTYSSATYAV